MNIKEATRKLEQALLHLKHAVEDGGDDDEGGFSENFHKAKEIIDEVDEEFEGVDDDF